LKSLAKGLAHISIVRLNVCNRVEVQTYICILSRLSVRRLT